MKSFKFLVCVVLSALLLLAGALPTMAYTGDGTTAYKMYVDDQEVGIVKFAARALSIYDKVEKKMRTERQGEVFIDAKVYFKEVRSDSRSILGDKALESAIEDAIDVRMDAYAIIVEGEKICYVKTTEEAQKIIDDIKAPYIEKAKKKEDSQLEDVTLKQDIQFEDEVVSEKEVVTPEEALDKLLHGGEAVKEYEAKDGDTFWSIAEDNNMDVDELMLANPDLDERRIKPGDIVKIGREEKLVTVVTKEKVTYTEELPFESEVKEDNTLEKGKTKVLQEGEKGEKEITALVTMEDGQEVARGIVDEKIVKEPVKHIEAKGTKVKPQPVPERRRSNRTSSNSSSRSSKTSSNKNSTSSNTSSRGGSVGSGTGAQVASYAQKFVGYPYKWGHTGPNAFDCSGFTHYVYKQFGVNISSGSVAQRSVGRRVDKSDLKPGDIVCFKNSNHVGIYIGGGQMVHASTPKKGVIISSINGGRYPSRYVTARRIFD